LDNVKHVASGILILDPSASDSKQVKSMLSLLEKLIEVSVGAGRDGVGDSVTKQL
jgi:hypothetical protein